LGKAIDSFMECAKATWSSIWRTASAATAAGTAGQGRPVEEHLKIEFHGGTKVYVPASKIGLVQKYVGGTKTRPVLAKIGGKTWVRQKKAAEAAVVDLAAEMLQMQAAAAAGRASRLPSKATGSASSTPRSPIRRRPTS
jgi:transcription-repair coupling factor (superfamily II helicase)